MPSTKPKQQMANFDLAVIVNEFKSQLIGTRIEKAYHPLRDTIILKLSLPRASYSALNPQAQTQKKLYLTIKNGRFIYIVNSIGPVPKVPSHFAMLLRKHIVHGIIYDLRQVEFDRIVELHIRRSTNLAEERHYRLVVELFGDGNIILVEDTTIIQPLIVQHWAHRTLKAGATYIYPPSRYNPLKLTFETFLREVDATTRDLVRFLAVDLNLGGLYAEELCARVGIDKNANPRRLDSNQLKAIFDELSTLLQETARATAPSIVFKDNIAVDIIPTKLKLYDTQELLKREVDCFNRAVAIYANLREKVEEETKLRAELQDAIEKYRRQVSQQRDAIAKFETEIVRYQHIGDLIYANIEICKRYIELAQGLRKTYRGTIEELVTYVKSNDNRIVDFNPYEGYITIKLDDLQASSPSKSPVQLDVKLDYRKKVTANAEDYYRLAKRTKQKLEGAQKSIESSLSELHGLEAREKKLRDTTLELSAEPLSPRARTFWFEKYRWFITTTGNIVIAGRDAASNDKVVKKYLKSHDKYCHADVHGAPSVVVKAVQVSPVPDEALQEACAFAVIYSSAWKMQLPAERAYWVNSDQVSKTPPPGEFLPRGAFMIRGKRNYIKSLPIELVIGEIDYEGTKKLMAGPRPAVISRATRYVVLRPGTMNPNVCAKKLSDAFQVQVETIQKLLPPGDIEIVETKSLDVAGSTTG
jgi:predicted ribosome quality control (RQC) complex YloA/Tae2 family protein